MHITCCHDDWALCSQFVGYEPEHEWGQMLAEGEEWCLTCLKLDSVSAPCDQQMLCPHLPRWPRFKWCLSVGLYAQAVKQLWKPRRW